MTSFAELPVVEILEPVSTFRLTHEESPVLSLSNNAEIINETFALSRRGKGMRFNDKAQGAWYCALENETAIEETAYHQIRRMEDSGLYGRPPVPDKPFVFQQFLAEFTGQFHDARGLPRNEGILGSDPETAYPLGQKLADKLTAEGGRGIVYPSVRRPEGTCLVAFHPQMVQNFQFGKRWKIRWNGSREYKVEECA